MFARRALLRGLKFQRSESLEKKKIKVPFDVHVYVFEDVENCPS